MKKEKKDIEQSFSYKTFTARLVKDGGLEYWEIHNKNKRVVGFAKSKEDVIEKINWNRLRKH